MAETLHFPASEAAKLEPHLPLEFGENIRPFLTLTYATSLDASIALAPGVRTTLSGPASKAMTHYLRSKHDAILVGVNTAIADDPALNCRIDTAQDLQFQPRPIVLDPTARWAFTNESKVIKVARDGRGKAPFVFTKVEDGEWDIERRRILEAVGGKYVFMKKYKFGGGWDAISSAIAEEGLNSVMVEGGGHVINSLLGHYPDLIDSVIVTIAPTWLGKGGVVVSPEQDEDEDGNPKAALRLKDVSWHQLGEDVVMCGKIRDEDKDR